MSSGACPLTPRRLDLVVPSGWSLEPEPESDKLTDDIMEAFIDDVNREQALDKPAPPSREQALEKPAPPSRFSAPLSDNAVAEARKAAVPK